MFISLPMKRIPSASIEFPASSAYLTKAVKPDYSYLVKNNGFCASLRLSSKETYFNETFSSISSKRSSRAAFCKLERSSSSNTGFLDFLTREPTDTHLTLNF
jgi:hypothetical protein